MLHQLEVPEPGGGSKTTTQQKRVGQTTTQSAKKATSRTQKRTTATTAKRQVQPMVSQADRRKAQEQDTQLGLMPSQLDEFNHNVFSADAAAIKGARDTESALRYMPFVTIVNTAGYGQGFDLRGQGRLSANGVKMFINGVPVNPTDSYSMAMPINTVIPQIIQHIDVFPGSGAVQYGSGTKGGTINIVTSKPRSPYWLVGGGYTNTTGAGSSFNAFASASEDFGRALTINASLAGGKLVGPREGDDSLSGEFALGVDYWLSPGLNLRLDTDNFYGKVKTTPYNSLWSSEAINNVMFNQNVAWTSTGGGQNDGVTQNINRNEINRYNCFSGFLNCGIDSTFEPSAENRSEKGSGEIEYTTIRSTGSLALTMEPASKLSLNLTGIYSLQNVKYDKNTLSTPFFMLGYIDPASPTNRGLIWFLPRPSSRSNSSIANSWIWNDTNTPVTFDGVIYGPGAYGEKGNSLADGIEPVLSDGQRADWHFIDQSGSQYSEYKFGLKGNATWKHTRGEFVLGIEGLYEMNKKKSLTHLRQALIDGLSFGGQDANGWYQPRQANRYQNFIVDIDSRSDISVITAAVYLMENYKLTNNLSVLLGGRYEMKNYNVKIKDTMGGSTIEFAGNSTENTTLPDNTDRAQTNFSSWKINSQTLGREFESEKFNQNFDNFTFEFAPAYRYSNSGLVYLRGEYGYVAPPAWAMFRRIGKVNGLESPESFKETNLNIANPIDFNFAYQNTELESETYYTAELGWKEAITNKIMPLGFTDLEISALLFSITGFYTGSQNEFFFAGDMWSGMDLGNYAQSRRMGAELAFEQILYGGVLNFNESFTYLKAEKKSEGESEFTPIPYTYDWKATLGISVDVSGYMEIVDVGLAVWLQNSIYGNQNIYARNVMVFNNLTAAQAAIPSLAGVTGSQQPYLVIVDADSKKLDPYFVSDIGVTLSINKGAASVTLGVKNVFNTFYYDYYNNDRSASVNENRYLIGRGRTVFLEGQYKY